MGRPIYVILFLVMIAVLLLIAYFLLQATLSWWSYRKAGPDRRRKERMAVLEENRELDNLLDQIDTRSAEREKRRRRR